MNSPPIWLSLPRPMAGRGILMPRLQLVDRLGFSPRRGSTRTYGGASSSSSSDPPQVRLSGRIRRRFRVDFSQLLRTARLGFLVKCTRQRDFISGSPDQSRDQWRQLGSKALVLRGMCTKTSGYHWLDHAGSSMGAATTAHRRLILPATVVVWWSILT